MRTLKRFIALSLCAIALSKSLIAQDTKTVDFYKSIKGYDLGAILTTDSFFVEDGVREKDKVKRPEPIGFIGDSFQRFYIHFTSVKKNEENPYEYIVTGKTKVKTTICSFEGTIKINSSRIYSGSDLPGYKQGIVVCDVSLFEDREQSSSGVIKGKLVSYFVIDDKKRFRYDGLDFVADGFSNNEFSGTWTSYRTNTVKICNWGDFRIPNSSGLDCGVAEFRVSDKHLNNGWLSYMLAFREDDEGRKARESELEEWWR